MAQIVVNPHIEYNNGFIMVIAQMIFRQKCQQAPQINEWNAPVTMRCCLQVHIVSKGLELIKMCHCQTHFFWGGGL